jgi:hypothetical protein
MEFSDYRYGRRDRDYCDYDRYYCYDWDFFPRGCYGRRHRRSGDF